MRTRHAAFHVTGTQHPALHRRPDRPRDAVEEAVRDRLREGRLREHRFEHRADGVEAAVDLVRVVADRDAPADRGDPVGERTVDGVQHPGRHRSVRAAQQPGARLVARGQASPDLGRGHEFAAGRPAVAATTDAVRARDARRAGRPLVPAAHHHALRVQEFPPATRAAPQLPSRFALMRRPRQRHRRQRVVRRRCRGRELPAFVDEPVRCRGRPGLGREPQEQRPGDHAAWPEDSGAPVARDDERVLGGTLAGLQAEDVVAVPERAEPVERGVAQLVHEPAAPRGRDDLGEINRQQLADELPDVRTRVGKPGGSQQVQEVHGLVQDRQTARPHGVRPRLDGFPQDVDQPRCAQHRFGETGVVAEHTAGAAQRQQIAAPVEHRLAQQRAEPRIRRHCAEAAATRPARPGAQADHGAGRRRAERHPGRQCGVDQVEVEVPHRQMAGVQALHGREPDRVARTPLSVQQLGEPGEFRAQARGESAADGLLRQELQLLVRRVARRAELVRQGSVRSRAVVVCRGSAVHAAYPRRVTGPFYQPSPPHFRGRTRRDPRSPGNGRPRQPQGSRGSGRSRVPRPCRCVRGRVRRG